MIEKIKESLRDLEKTDDYKNWRKEHKESYLSNVFFINEESWQICYYNPKKDKLTTFLDNKLLKADGAIFKKNRDKINELKIENIKIDFEDALKVIEKLVKEKYSHETLTTKIVILQNINAEMWNITYLTSTFNVLNVKINAINGEMISEKLTAAMQFGNRDK